MASSNPKADSPGDETLAAYKALGMSFLERSKKPGSIGRLSHYEILKVLGEGGYGMVLKAFDEKLTREVAIKVLSSEFGAGSTPRARFVREARAAAAIRHENVVAIYAVEEEPNPYLVMEYIPGETLQNLVDRLGRLPVKDVLTIGGQIARGLAAAHEKSLIHRDIKPCNILVEQIGGVYQAKIADFGLALASTDARLTQSGMVAGTPMYMSPEQARGDKLDPRSDLFSLGCVLYTALTGHPAFGEGNPMVILEAIIRSHPKPIRDFAPEAPQWVSGIIGKLLAKKREDRYQSAKDVGKIFADVLENPPVDKVRKPQPAAAAPTTAGAGVWQKVVLLVLVIVAAAGCAYAATLLFFKPS
ncbi:serine/threonine-protein kinase [Limnoglobus roseus]|uniref:non-specific serine/threonine protein kinase n=1 Tax=Limnoglobus roseus TaxID=2598579 RepID=A0A5C1ACE2_9BACT|nr:serine/threonine-protein kinase [Limnoglobus roseus]QEL14708.1 serine/threonine-protein kinase PknB [Limnoglobus roseus]